MGELESKGESGNANELASSSGVIKRAWEMTGGRTNNLGKRLSVLYRAIDTYDLPTVKKSMRFEWSGKARLYRNYAAVLHYFYHETTSKLRLQSAMKSDRYKYW